MGVVPSSCKSMFVFRRFLARSTSKSVMAVHMRIHSCLNVVEHVLNLHPVADKVDSPQPCVLVAGVEGLEAQGESFGCTVLGEAAGVVGSTSHGPVPTPDHGVGNHEGDVVRIGPSASLHRDRDVSERHVIVPDPDIRTGVPTREVQGDLGIIIFFNLAKVLICKLAELLVIDASGPSQNHPWALVVGVDVVHEVIPGDRLDVLGGPRIVRPKGVPW